ncbi:MAG: hypothetical protein HC848_10160, partial [Limnobacter sp.]|nr:hypothetical protein [Limnobacter sp.]
TMIVDCHAHVFAHWIGACGHPTREIHKRYLQRVVTRTVATTFRVRDGARADTKALFRAGDEGWSGLADVDFRVGRFGQLEFSMLLSPRVPRRRLVRGCSPCLHRQPRC